MRISSCRLPRLTCCSRCPLRGRDAGICQYCNMSSDLTSKRKRQNFRKKHLIFVSIIEGTHYKALRLHDCFKVRWKQLFESGQNTINSRVLLVT